MRPDQLPLITTLSAPAVHPDGTWVVVAATQPDFAADDYVGQLWRVPLNKTTPPRRLTRGFRDSTPKFSPDGKLVGFLRSEPEQKTQLYVAPANGGEPVQVTDAKLGVSEFAFSPDSRTLVYTARVPEEDRYGTTDGVSGEQEDPRRITGFKFRMNEVGFTNDKRVHLFTVAVPDPFDPPLIKPVGRAAKAAKNAAPWQAVPPSRQLTDGDADDTQPVFTPDGQSVLFTSSRHDSADSDLVTSLYRVPFIGGKPELFLEDLNLAAQGAVVVGEHVFFIGEDFSPSGRDFVGRNPGVYAMPVTGGVPERLTDAETIGIVGELTPFGDDAVLAIEDLRGRQRILRLRRDGHITVVFDEGVAQAAAAIPGEDGAVAVVAGPANTDELVYISDQVTTLTSFSAALTENTQVSEPIELTATAPDGYPVHGWVYLPEGAGPHPVLLNIHGGPFAAYQVNWFDEFQIYTEAGYAVVACNPRGSSGYGQEHGRAIRGDFGNLDATDILAFLDHAVATVDGLAVDRIGVMGGSYGGYMTAWLIGHDHRFSGAIVERGFLDPRSFVGASDIGWFFTHEYNTEDPVQMDAQSPMHLTNQVRTPTLVLHSEDDLRCPLDQAVRYYTQLKLAGVETELLVFPGENHELSRSGTPWHRRQRFEAILDWWAKYLPVG
jgi:dipeptidyl aminopeptidase/acylaminoacyl peptidase